MGGTIVPRSMVFSKGWMIKFPDLIGEAQQAEELEHLHSDEDLDALRRVFEIADIQYGRIDYGKLDGRIQVWEINTNPSLAGPISDLKPEREHVHALFATRMNRCLADLDAKGPESGRLVLNLNLWWRPPWLS
jgi:hypothetical protein